MNKALFDDVCCHVTEIIGLAALGSPQLGEPIADAVHRVQIATRFDDATLALQVAGLRAIAAHPEEDAMRALFDSIPDWLDSFLLGQVDRHVLRWPARDLSGVPPFTSACNRAALDAWPDLPAGPAIFEESA